MSRINSGAGGITQLGGIAPDFQTGSISDLYFLIQTRRATLLEDQVRSQTRDMWDNIQQIKSLQEVKGTFATQKGYFSGSASPDSRLIDQNPYADQYKKLKPEQVEAYRRVSDPADPLYDPDYLTRAANGEFGGAYQSLAAVAVQARSSGQSESAVRSYATGTVTSAGIDATISSIQGGIDSLSSTQQLQMLSLQSTMSKRSEAFDSASNFLKKNADTLGTVISNMR